VIRKGVLSAAKALAMDFTYFVAGALGVAVGFVVTTLLAISRMGSTARAFGASFGIALLLDAMLLINWTAINSLPLGVLIIDLAMIAAFTGVGCALGMSPPLLVKGLIRGTRRPKV